ncbi:MAG TPA: aspartate/glutamate racemase family protein [Desulfobacteraceae bacterium]|nr:aspartate/glutamate racemase family protein [Desulfobacteraceae bacterium]
MKTIGMIGGMSWESSVEYYRLVNLKVREAMGGLHSAECIMYSFDFADIETLQNSGKWDEAAELLLETALKLENAGADFVIICTNTMHKNAGFVAEHINIPLLHIADAAAAEVKGRGIKSVGLLGTQFTMEEDFYKGRLAEKHGLEVLVPDRKTREEVNRVIYEELCRGVIRPESRNFYRDVVEKLAERGAGGIILGCTEIGLLVKQEDSPVPVFDTTEIHASAAVRYALGTS